MMVEHDDVEAGGLRRRQRLVRRNSAIDRQDQPDALILQAQQGVGVGAVALGNPVRHIEAQRCAELGEIPVQERRRGRAVDIVVAEHGRRLPVFQGGNDPLDRGVHVPEMRWVRQRGL